MIYTEIETALLEAGLEGDFNAAMQFLEKRCPHNRIRLVQDASGVGCTLHVWPNNYVEGNEVYKFESYGETIPECIVLAVRDYDRYKVTGTNYQITEMG